MINAKEAKAKTKKDFSEEEKQCLKDIERYIQIAMKEGKYDTMVRINNKISHTIIAKLEQLGYRVVRSKLEVYYYIDWQDAV